MKATLKAGASNGKPCWHNPEQLEAVKDRQVSCASNVTHILEPGALMLAMLGKQRKRKPFFAGVRRAGI